jgi:hypothetical protein
MGRTTKHRKTVRKIKRRPKTVKKNLYLGGGCPCQLGLGGNNQTGGYGAASLQPIPLRSYYELNSLNNDPSVAAISSRNLPNFKGGKRSKRAKKTLKRIRFKIQRGGNPSAIEYTGTTPGAFMGRDLINGTTVIDPAPYVQPTLNIYAHPLA